MPWYKHAVRAQLEHDIRDEISIKNSIQLDDDDSSHSLLCLIS